MRSARNRRRRCVDDAAMTGTSPLPPAVERLAIACLGLVAIYLALVPFGAPDAPPMPDVTFCIVAAWVIRRPAAAPFWMVLGLGLLADVMLSRPMGLGALALLVVSERLRAHARVFHGTAFPIEWLAVTLAFAAQLAIIAAGLAFTFVEGPPISVLGWYLAATALAYPVVVAALRVFVRLRMPQAGRAPMRLGRLR